MTNPVQRCREELDCFEVLEILGLKAHPMSMTGESRFVYCPICQPAGAESRNEGAGRLPDGSETPSLYLRKKGFRCSRCNRVGDHIGLVAHIHDTTWGLAAKWLAAKKDWVDSGLESTRHEWSTLWHPPITAQQSQLFPDEDSPAARWGMDAGKRALDELFSLTSQYRSGNTYHNLLKFVSRFRRYSPYNAMLVHIQKPGSRFVASPSRWLKQYGRRIKPGAQALVILQPKGPVMFVFDVSDTEGDPLPPSVENPFAVRCGQVGGELERTIQNACRDGIRITKVRHGSQRAGSIGPTESPGQFLQFGEKQQVPLRYEMLLNANHSRESQYATLVHELAHLYCGHFGTSNEKWWPDRRGLPLEVQEFEAESVAYLVCRRRGVDPKSDEYLSGYRKQGSDVPPISLACVMKVAGLIESTGREKLKPRKQP